MGLYNAELTPNTFAQQFNDGRDRVVRNRLAEREMVDREAQSQAYRNQLGYNQAQTERGNQQEDAATAAAGEKQQQQAAYAAAARIAAAPLGQKKQMAIAALGQSGIEHYRQQGVDIAAMDEAAVGQLAQQIEASIGSQLGLMPQAAPTPESYTLGPGQHRYVGDKMVASVAPTPRNGMRITSDGAGGFSLYDGPDAAGVDLTNPTRNALQTSAVNAQAGIDRLSGIRQGFDPRWLQYKDQAIQYVNSIRAKSKGIPFVSNLSEQETSDLSAFSRFKSDTTDNLNRYITEITGAAMGVQEAKRIISTMPSLEDDPNSFQTKLDRVEERLKLVLARSVYTQREGIKFDAIPIDQMRSIMNKRGDEIFSQKVAELKDPAAAKQATVEALNAEFYQ